MSVFTQASNIIVTGGNFTAQSTTTNGAAGMFTGYMARIALSLHTCAYSNSEAPTLQQLVSNSATGALHDSAERFDPPKCHPLTRQAIIERVMDWLDDKEQSLSFVWIYGPAGVGKSAIAQSIADLCFERGRLAGSFFFGRTSARRNTKDFFVPTIVYQMITILPEMRDRVFRSIETDPAIFSRSLEAQAQALIIQPLNETARDATQGPSLRSRPVSLVIIDGLDECDLPESQSQILRTLSQVATQLSTRLLFLIASRPEQAIRSAFRDESLSSITSFINLDDFSKDVDTDIRVFLDSKFQSISHRHPARYSFPRPWPTENEMDCLVEKANGHFIYASTVMKYLESSKAHPVQRLTHILEQNIPKSDAPLAALDALYLQILSAVTDTDVETLCNILAIILLADDNSMTKAASIEKLLRFSPGTVQIVLSDLHSVILVPEDPKNSLRIFHASFSDFLFDCTRSAKFFLDRERRYLAIAKALMKINFDLNYSGLYVYDTVPLFFSYYDKLDLEATRVNLHKSLGSFNFFQLIESTDQDKWSMKALSKLILWLIDKRIPYLQSDVFTLHIHTILDWVLLSLLPTLFKRFLPDASAAQEELLASVTSTWVLSKNKHVSAIMKNPSEMHPIKECCVAILEDFFCSSHKSTQEEYIETLVAIRNTLKEEEIARKRVVGRVVALVAKKARWNILRRFIQ